MDSIQGQCSVQDHVSFSDYHTFTPESGYTVCGKCGITSKQFWDQLVARDGEQKVLEQAGQIHSDLILREQSTKVEGNSVAEGEQE
jgi:hypothetical protein